MAGVKSRFEQEVEELTEKCSFMPTISEKPFSREALEERKLRRQQEVRDAAEKELTFRPRITKRREEASGREGEQVHDRLYMTGRAETGGLRAERRNMDVEESRPISKRVEYLYKEGTKRLREKGGEMKRARNEEKKEMPSLEKTHKMLRRKLVLETRKFFQFRQTLNIDEFFDLLAYIRYISHQGAIGASAISLWRSICTSSDTATSKNVENAVLSLFDSNKYSDMVAHRLQTTSRLNQSRPESAQPPNSPQICPVSRKIVENLRLHFSPTEISSNRALELVHLKRTHC